MEQHFRDLLRRNEKLVVENNKLKIKNGTLVDEREQLRQAITVLRREIYRLQGKVADLQHEKLCTTGRYYPSRPLATISE